MSSNRIIYLEVLRIMATIAVLLNHVPLVALHYYGSSATDIDNAVIMGINHIVHFAVPVFVMITGALLLQKERPISWRKALSYAWRMIVILGTVGVVFAWMEIYFGERHFCWQQIPKAILNTLQGKTWTHLWYLYMLIGIYLVLPALKSIVNILTQKQLDVMIAILLVFTSVNPMLSHFADINIGVRFPIMSEYVAYMLIGYRLQHYNINKVLLCGLLLVMVLFYVILSWYEYIAEYGSIKELAAYNSPLMALYSSLIFVLVKNTCSNLIINKFWTSFSSNSFGVYVFHMLYINIVYKVLKVNPFEVGCWTFIPIFIGVTMLSWITTIIFRKLPLIGKYV